MNLETLERDLPAFSSVVLQLMKSLKDPNIPVSRIETLIQQDPALIGRVLRVANSPIYSSHTQSRTIRDAIVRVGMTQLINMVIVAASGQLFDEHDPEIRLLWDHSIASGLAASIIAEKFCRPLKEEAFLGGIFHDVGKMIIRTKMREAYSQVVTKMQATHCRSFEVEEEQYRYFTHMSVGGLALRNWSFGENIVKMARFHHAVEENIEQDLHNAELVCIASLASIIANNLEYGNPVCKWDDTITFACARHFNISLADIETFAIQINQSFKSQRAALAP